MFIDFKQLTPKYSLHKWNMPPIWVQEYRKAAGTKVSLHFVLCCVKADKHKNNKNYHKHPDCVSFFFFLFAQKKKEKNGKALHF